MLKQEAYETLWSTDPFSAAASKFLDSLNLIHALVEISNPGKTIITANKKRLTTAVVNRTMDMASSLSCYAAIKRDEILASKVSLSPAMITRSWDPVIFATATSIYDIAAELIDTREQEAIECGITPRQNQLLLNSIVAFAAAIATETKPPADVSLETELQVAEEILNHRITSLVTSFKSQSEAILASFREEHSESHIPDDYSLNG